MMCPFKTLTVVCILRFPTVGRPEIRCLTGKQSEKVIKDIQQPVIPILCNLEENLASQNCAGKRVLSKLSCRNWSDDNDL